MLFLVVAYIWIQNSKEEILAVDDLHRIGPKNLPEQLDILQFNDLIDSLSPYYQMHLQNYMDYLEKTLEKLDSLSILASEHRYKELERFFAENQAENARNTYKKARRLYESYKYSGKHSSYIKPTLEQD
ncbi:hypothetical protein [Fibrobacter sp. UWS1]|uniref:hypothetical protein n=1 Tax=Fibrobacter sp. UWS1 TaxID=1896220 RepID=UPI000BC905DF|nr:hypothetical protein [Fibrobacter sp. UWS1]PBC66806.1 hypothetical protein BGX14_2441 [Fibrobacter sp. UWS1]